MHPNEEAMLEADDSWWIDQISRKASNFSSLGLLFMLLFLILMPYL